MQIHTGLDCHMTEMLLCAKEFVQESDHLITYSEYNSTMYFISLLNDTSTDVILIRDGNEVAGIALVGYEADFHKERFGYVIKFYIRKRFRGTTAGRLLADSMGTWFDINDCIKSFATSTAGIQEDKLFINLLGKYGFLPEGTVLTRNK